MLKKFYKEAYVEKLKQFKKRIVSLFMAVIMFLGCFGYALGQSDTANAATDNLAMKINKNGDIVWSTENHVNPNSEKRFHTIGWNFTIIRDGKTFKHEQILLENESRLNYMGSADSNNKNYILVEPGTSMCDVEEKKKQPDPTMKVTILVPLTFRMKKKKIKAPKAKKK